MLKFLWQDSYTKEPSASKIWMHISYGVSTYIVIRMDNIGWEILLVYMAVVGGSEIAKKLLTMKFGGHPEPKSKLKSPIQPPDEPR